MVGNDETSVLGKEKGLSDEYLSESDEGLSESDEDLSDDALDLEEIMREEFSAGPGAGSGPKPDRDSAKSMGQAGGQEAASMSSEDIVSNIIENNYSAKINVYRNFGPVESVIMDVFLDGSYYGVNFRTKNSSEALRAFIFLDVYAHLVTEPDLENGFPDMGNMKTFWAQVTGYVALEFVTDAKKKIFGKRKAKQVSDNDERLRASISTYLSKKGSRTPSEIGEDEFKDLREPNPIYGLVANQYLAMFENEPVRNAVVRAKNLRDLKYLVFIDAYYSQSPESLRKDLDTRLRGEDLRRLSFYVPIFFFKETFDPNAYTPV